MIAWRGPRAYFATCPGATAPGMRSGGGGFGQQRFGLSAPGCRRHALPLPALHNPPATGGWLAGFLNLGGAPIPVIDLAPLLGLRQAATAPSLYAHLVLTRDDVVAYLVDRAADLVVVPDSAIRPAEEAGTLNGCVAAELVIGDSLVHALAPEGLLTAQERARIAALTRAAAERLAALPPSA